MIYTRAGSAIQTDGII